MSCWREWICCNWLRAQSSCWASGIHPKRKFIIYLISKKKEINQQTIDQITDAVLKFEENSKILILAPVIKGRKGEHLKVFENEYYNKNSAGLLNAIEDLRRLVDNKTPLT